MSSSRSLSSIAAYLQTCGASVDRSDNICYQKTNKISNNNYIKYDFPLPSSSNSSKIWSGAINNNNIWESRKSHKFIQGPFNKHISNCENNNNNNNDEMTHDFCDNNSAYEQQSNFKYNNNINNNNYINNINIINNNNYTPKHHKANIHNIRDVGGSGDNYIFKGSQSAPDPFNLLPAATLETVGGPIENCKAGTTIVSTLDLPAQTSDKNSDNIIINNDDDNNNTSQSVANSSSRPDFSDLIDTIRPSMIQIFSSPTNSLQDITFIGSGFIYKEEGLALTAAHLFEISSSDASLIDSPHGKRHLFARLADGRWFSVSLLGMSSDADVAVVKLNSQKVNKFPSVKMGGTRRSPRQGEYVIAYGTTRYGDEPVATVGTISQPRQSFRELKVGLRTRFIQLGIITIPGFSGSPVFDSDGLIVAMIVKKFDEYALALPISQIEGVVRSIELTGTWSMPYIGLVLRSPDDELEDDIINLNNNELPTHPQNNSSRPKYRSRSRACLPYGYGVWVESVKSGSPAERSGLRMGDVILEVNGEAVHSHYELFENPEVMSGSPISLKIYRNSKEFHIQITPISQRRL